MKVHKSLTTDVVMRAYQRYQTSLDNPGFCVACGEEADNVEPDARKYSCDNCGEDAVYGVAELLLACC